MIFAFAAFDLFLVNSDRDFLNARRAGLFGFYLFGTLVLGRIRAASFGFWLLFKRNVKTNALQHLNANIEGHSVFRILQIVWCYVAQINLGDRIFDGFRRIDQIVRQLHAGNRGQHGIPDGGQINQQVIGRPGLQHVTVEGINQRADRQFLRQIVAQKRERQRRIGQVQRLGQNL